MTKNKLWKNSSTYVEQIGKIDRELKARDRIFPMVVAVFLLLLGLALVLLPWTDFDFVDGFYGEIKKLNVCVRCENH